jgi:CRP/FNR family transcriptional regulator, cyclic AMP receptor protein
MIPLEVLKNIRFLQDIGDAHLRLVASVAEIKELAPSKIVFREGHKSTFIYLVIQGHVALEIGVPGRGAVRIYTVGAGELLGWSSLLGTDLMTATARTMDACRLLALDARQTAALCVHEPAMGVEFMRRTALALAKRLEATRLQLLDVYGTQLPVVANEGGAP